MKRISYNPDVKKKKKKSWKIFKTSRRKAVNTGNQHFLLFHTMFYIISKTQIINLATLILSFENVFSLVDTKIGIELFTHRRARNGTTFEFHSMVISVSQTLTF